MYSFGPGTLVGAAVDGMGVSAMGPGVGGRVLVAFFVAVGGGRRLAGAWGKLQLVKMKRRTNTENANRFLVSIPVLFPRDSRFIKVFNEPI